MRVIGRRSLDREDERRRFETWAGKLGLPWDDRVWEDLVDMYGLKATVNDLETAYLNEQRKEGA